MKRNLTFKLKAIYADYKTKIPTDIEKRIGKLFKLLGDIKVGNKLEMHFEDGFIFKTNTLDIEGYIIMSDDFITLCTKDLAFEMDITKSKKKFKTVEQLSLL